MKRGLAWFLGITLAMLAIAKVQDEEDMLLQSRRHALDRESECKLEWVDPQGQMTADQLRHRVEELCADPHWAVANAGTCRAVLDELFETRSRIDMCEELNKARELWLQHGHDKGTLPEASLQSHIDHSAMVADRLAARGTSPAEQLAPNADDAHIALDQFDRMLSGGSGMSCKGCGGPDERQRVSRPAPRPTPLWSTHPRPAYASDGQLAHRRRIDYSHRRRDDYVNPDPQHRRRARPGLPELDCWRQRPCMAPGDEGQGLGSDNGPVNGHPGKSLYQCKEWCERTDDCKSFVHSESQKSCHLKDKNVYIWNGKQSDCKSASSWNFKMYYRNPPFYFPKDTYHPCGHQEGQFNLNLPD